MKKILIVEDEPSLSGVILKKLEDNGYEATIAKNGAEGLQAALKDKPDLILLDIIMPVMDGLEMLNKLREDEWDKDVSVIILTNLSEAEKTAEAMERGVHDFLVKADWSLDDIIKKVDEKLK